MKLRRRNWVSPLLAEDQRMNRWKISGEHEPEGVCL